MTHITYTVELLGAIPGSYVLRKNIGSAVYVSSIVIEDTQVGSG